MKSTIIIHFAQKVIKHFRKREKTLSKQIVNKGKTFKGLAKEHPFSMQRGGTISSVEGHLPSSRVGDRKPVFGHLGDSTEARLNAKMSDPAER